MRRLTSLTAVAASSLFFASSLAAQSSRMNAAEAEAFFDTIHAPNYLGAEIAHTSIKSQKGGTCWGFSTVAFLESEVLRENPDLAATLSEKKEELDLSEYFVVYWAYVEKAREYARRQGEGARFTDGGLSHDVTWLIAEYGIVPETDYVVVDDYRAMRADLNSVLERHTETGNWDEGTVVAEIRAVLDQHLAPPPETIEIDGVNLTPVEYAAAYLALDPSELWEITSYTALPGYGRAELDIPDNWWDYDGYYNVPLDDFIRVMNEALDAGYPVVIDTDWGDMGAGWNSAGIAVMHPDMLDGRPVDETSRQGDLDDGRTTDDHLVLAIDHRVVDGVDWYLIKNSHGTGSGRRGYVWMRGDFFAMRVLAIMVHRDAIDAGIVAMFEGET